MPDATILLLGSLASNVATKTVSHAKLAEEISKIMSDLGDQEFSNAKGSLANVASANDKRLQLTNAVGHLETAASNFESAYNREEKKFWGPNWKLQETLKHKQSICYAMITSIYAGLGERALLQKYAILYRKAIAEYLVASDRNMRDILDRDKEWEAAKKFLTDLNTPLEELSYLPSYHWSTGSSGESHYLGQGIFSHD